MGRLTDIRTELEVTFVKGSNLKHKAPPVDIVLPDAKAMPAEGQVVREYPKLGEVAVERNGTEFAVPVAHPNHGSNPKEHARRWTGPIIERLVQHALSDDYRASIPACNILLERGWGKARQEEPEAQQAAIDMSSMPVRDRIKALLDARAGGGTTATAEAMAITADGETAEATTTDTEAAPADAQTAEAPPDTESQDSTDLVVSPPATEMTPAQILKRVVIPQRHSRLNRNPNGIYIDTVGVAITEGTESTSKGEAQPLDLSGLL